VSGKFTTSNPLINQLQHNIQWGQNGNFLDVPTDCPQRDERLGWTGDAQVFSTTAAFNRNVYNFFSKWLKDVAADQQPDGRVPFVVPNVLGPQEGGSAGWADAATIIPWNMYQSYGDKAILKQQYASMKLWISFMEKNSKDDLWNAGFHFGDWLFYRPDDDNDGRAALTDKYLIAQCFYANSVQIMVQSAEILEQKDEVMRYKDLLKRVKDAFLKEYVTASGRLVSSSQTAYVLALQFDMLPEVMRSQAATRLVENIKSYSMHLTTGFLGTPYLCHVLTRFGYSDVAFSLLLQESYPSWLYPVKMGATTIWERWDGQKPDGSFQTPGMNSFNHYAYGAIGDWMYRVVAGINPDPEAPGYKKIIIKPILGGGFTDAIGSLKTNYGTVSSSWSLVGNKLQLDVEIPANTSAKIFIPATSSDSIMEGGKAVKAPEPKDGYAELHVGSGVYKFTSVVQASKK
jgi:alpha-L-rhamnosidase